MGALVTRRIRSRQAHGAALIDRSNALGARVIECLPLNGQPNATVSGAKLTLANGVINAAKDRALALRSNGTACASFPLDLSKYSKITIAFWLYWDAYANNDALAMELGAAYGANNGFLVDPNCSSPASFMFGSGENTNSNLVTFPRPSAGTWHRIALTMNRAGAVGASCTAYVDGVAQAISAFPGAAPTSGNFGSDTLHLFSRNEASLLGTGSMEMLTFYDGILSAAEAAEDYQNCYQVLKPRAARLWVAPSLAAGASTPTSITASLGSIAGAGQSGAVSLPTVLACGSAGNALSGQKASIVLPVTVACSVGAMSAVGSAAQVSIPTVISATTATVTASGQTASISSGSGIACATAGVQAFGLTASIVIPVNIGCVTAGVTAFGATAGITLPSTINCARAASVATGLAASVVLPTVIGCAPASMTATGRASQVLTGTTISASAAGVVAQGRSAAISIPGVIPPVTLDANLIPTTRWITFEGTARVVVFEGTGRVVAFEGNDRTVRFE